MDYCFGIQNGGSSMHPLLEGIGQFGPTGEQRLELLFLLLHPSLPFLIVHKCVGPFPNGVFSEEDPPRQFNLVLKSSSFSCLFLAFLWLFRLLIMGLLFEVFAVFVLHIIIELLPAGVLLLLGVFLLLVKVVVLIVVTLELLVGEDVVGLLNFRELVMTLGIQIWVQFLDEFEIGPFDGVFAGTAFDLQDPVVILVEINALGKGTGLAAVGAEEVEDGSSSHRQYYQETQKQYSGGEQEHHSIKAQTPYSSYKPNQTRITLQRLIYSQWLIPKDKSYIEVAEKMNASCSE